MKAHSLGTKLRHALRIDRAIRLVWQTSPALTVMSALSLTVAGILPVLGLYLLKLIIDRLVNPGNATLSSIQWLIALTCGLGLLSALFNSINDFLRRKQTLGVSDYVFSIIHAHAIQSDLSLFENPAHRNLLYRAQVEGPYRPTAIVARLFATIKSGASFMGSAVLIATLNPALPFAMVAAAVPGVIIRLGYSAKIYHWQQKRTEDERKSLYFHEILSGAQHAKEIRLFGLGTLFFKKFQKIRKTLRNEILWFEKRRSAGNFFAQACITIAVFFCLALIVRKTFQGQITIGDTVMYFQAFTGGVGYLKTMLEDTAQMYEDNLFLSYLNDFLLLQPQIRNESDPLPVPDQQPCHFQFKDVTFFYQGCEKKVLKKVNFFIKSGEIVAVVGKNGSGKSTIVKLLSRLYDPAGGEVILNAENIKRYDIEAYRKNISVVFQDHVHFFLTALENIQLGDLEKRLDMEKIQDAAQKSGAAEAIDNFPSGYQTLLGRMFQNGHEPSLGQWQMLAVARAFYRDAALIILDEPSSALDPETEAAVFSGFRGLVKGKSALFISHRLSNAKIADRILMVEDGEVVESGTHATLMKQNGKYAALYQTQADAYTS